MAANEVYVSNLPADARAGLMRAWLAILSERHPNVTWIPLEQGSRHGEDKTELISGAK